MLEIRVITIDRMVERSIHALVGLINEQLIDTEILREDIGVLSEYS